MAYEHGTAANYIDLLDKLRIFATSHADLVAAGQQWVQKRWSNNELFLQGPGLDGQQKIIAGARALAFATQDAYNWGALCAQDYSDNYLFAGQRGTSAEGFVPLWNDQMPYWFVGNGQRIVVVAKVSNHYMPMYLGGHLPWGLPGDYPGPLFVGTCTATNNLRWSATDPGFRCFADPGNGTQVLAPSGNWLSVRNYYNSASSEVEDSNVCIWPYAGMRTATSTILRSLRENGDGTYTPFPLVVHGNAPAPEIYGELDGCYYIPGFANAAETIVPIDGVDHLVVPNLYRTESWNYWLLRLS